LKGPVQPHLSPFGSVFIAKLSPSGKELVYSTYLGGSISDGGNAIAVDAAGSAYVTGITSSPDFPITDGAFQSLLAGGRAFDAFVVKLSPDGGSINYSTYLGGGEPMFDAYDYGNSIAVDALGNAYVAGRTMSTDFPTTPGVVQSGVAPSGLNPPLHAFVTKMNPTGSSLLYSTYLGGSGTEEALGIAVDSVGNAYITGYTASADFPVTPGALQSVFGRQPNDTNSSDVFVTKLNGDGTAFVYSTYLGGGWLDSGNSIAVDASGNAYVSGTTESFNFPTTSGAIKPNYGGGFYKSGNSGRQWQNSNIGLATPTPRALAVDPKAAGHLYLATGAGLYSSANAGESWKQINNILLWTLVINPVNPAILYGSAGFGIVKSTDGGSTWAAATNGLPLTLNIRTLLIDPVQPSTLYVTGLGFFGFNPTLQEPEPPVFWYLFKSTDAGSTWEVHSRLPFQHLSSLVMDPNDPFRLFVRAERLIFRSQNGGATWKVMNDSASHRPVVVDPKTPGTMYGIGDGVGKSTDDGRSWTDISNGLPKQARLSNLYAVPTTPTTLYASTFDGIFISTDAGANWRASSIAGDIAFVGFEALNTSTIYTGVNDPSDSFVAKLNPSGSALVYSTYLGGQSGEGPGDIALDAAGNAYVTGYTFSSSFPTQNALQTTKPPSAIEITPASIAGFLTKLNLTGSELLYSTYLGGDDSTSALGVRVAPTGDVYVTGQTGAENFPIKDGLQPKLAGELDAFILKLAAPRITGCALSGKHLIVNGDGFDESATILINGVAQSTKTQGVTLLVVKKAGKQIAPGQNVVIQVRNSDSSLSNLCGLTRILQ